MNNANNQLFEKYRFQKIIVKKRFIVGLECVWNINDSFMAGFRIIQQRIQDLFTQEWNTPLTICTILKY